MRCTKCGKIIHDYLENCSFCGGDLRDVRNVLGYHVSTKGFSWFDVEGNPSQYIREEADIPEQKRPGISDIDISDLLPEERRSVSKEEEKKEIFEIDQDELEKISSEVVLESISEDKEI